MSAFHSEVIVVGAGAAGATVSWRLASLGAQVVCLEQGDWADVTSFPTNSPDWEFLKRTSFNPNPNVRQAKSDYSTIDDDSPISIANYNGVGGGTILYSGHYPRFHPSDFLVKTLDDISDDWPISYEDLAPYYDLNSTMTAVAGLEGDPAYPPIPNLLPPVPMGVMGEKLALGFNNLGWHWWPAYSAIATKEFRNHSQCINVGSCNSGCPQGAKSSVDVSYWPDALKLGVELKTKSTVHSVQIDEEINQFQVKYFNSEGHLFTATSNFVILACNGIGTPRILLNSKSEKFPNGLANNHDLVGRNLMMHPVGYVEGLFRDDLKSQLGPQGCCISSQQFYETDKQRGFYRGYTMQVLRGPGPVEFAISELQKLRVEWGLKHHKKFLERFDRTAHVAIIVEDLPELHNRILLDSLKSDEFGIPLPKISYKVSENSKKALSHGLQSGRKLMEASGAISSEAFGPVRHTGWHLMGTTRMGKDPDNSVVNSDFEAHQVPNLFIVDSGVFVTSAAVNPANTVQSLALMAADKIIAKVRLARGRL
jgi:choline dehydrogenase-like flavoprotein